MQIHRIIVVRRKKKQWQRRRVVAHASLLYYPAHEENKRQTTGKRANSIVAYAATLEYGDAHLWISHSLEDKENVWEIRSGCFAI